jgi:hypothetical protein
MSYPINEKLFNELTNGKRPRISTPRKARLYLPPKGMEMMGKNGTMTNAKGYPTIKPNK